MIRAVLDANVFVSGILSEGGHPGRILRAWQQERFHLVTSEAILTEVGRVLRYPKILKRHGWSKATIESFLDDVAGSAILTAGELRLSLVASDPSDDRYLECAEEGEASHIVSGDRHQLEVTRHHDVEIVRPRTFLELLVLTGAA